MHIHHRLEKKKHQAECTTITITQQQLIEDVTRSSLVSVVFMMFDRQDCGWFACVFVELDIVACLKGGESNCGVYLK